MSDEESKNKSLQKMEFHRINRTFILKKRVFHLPMQSLLIQPHLIQISSALFYVFLMPQSREFLLFLNCTKSFPFQSAVPGYPKIKWRIHALNFSSFDFHFMQKLKQARSLFRKY